VVARFDEPVRGWEGVHQAYQVREFEQDGLLFAAVNVPPSVLAMGLPMYGAKLGKFLANYQHLLTAGLLCEDTGTGSVRFSPRGWPQCFYQLNDRDFANLCRGTALLSELLFSAGARTVLTPFAQLSPLDSPDQLATIDPAHLDKAETELLTVHLMGTARMGPDRTRAVTDEFGKVYGADGLIIADASLFPSPIGVNPAETIHALATRNAHHLLQEFGRDS
jgi:choline dehydrogenase-like flavoprotein